MPAVLFVRHGLTVWNAEGRWQGWQDVPLAAEGAEQAAQAAHTLQGWEGDEPPVRFDRLVTSPLRRALDTAQAIAGALGLGDIDVDADLRERHIGDWSGRTTAEIEERWPGALERWRKGHGSPPGGEDEHAFRTRIERALDRAASVAFTRRATTLVVAHGGVIRTLELLKGTPPSAVANLGGRWFHATRPDDVVPGHTVDLLGAHAPRPATVVL